MDSARIAALLQPFLGDAVLSPQQLADISTYIDLLLRWNARINLTAVRQPDEIVTRHFGESFFAARHLFPLTTDHVGADALVCPGGAQLRNDSFTTTASGTPTSPSTQTPGVMPCPALKGQGFSPAEPGSYQGTASAVPESPSDKRAFRRGDAATPGSLADLGSGAGFPGLPIKLWAPTLHVTLIESTQKKVAFLRELLRTLKSTGIDVFPARAEALVNEDLGRQFDVVTLRAVERFANILPVAAALTAPAGRLALLIVEDQAAAVPAQLPAFTWDTPLRVPASARRVLLVGRRSI
jgi:16S rRNA G527 N7-methylase RsmG